jgi:cytochrome d ubiquinol oxidase subunit II
MIDYGIDLNLTWFILVGVLLAGYAILDGFDLGVGAIYLTVKGDTNRRLLLNSIGPVWDGNEVWLVTGGGALFAAFPDVYATVFSGFYPVVMLLIFTLVFRAVAIEFRSKETMPWWRNTWDRAFSLASIFIALLMGAALGNILTGVPLGPDKEFAGTLLDILHPFKLLVGITTVALFTMHGTIYAVLKTEGDLQEELKGKVNNTIVFFVITYAITTMATLIYYPHMSQPFVEQPFLFLLALANMLLVANIPREIYHGREFRAFLSSAGTIAYPTDALCDRYFSQSGVVSALSRIQSDCLQRGFVATYPLDHADDGDNRYSLCPGLYNQYLLGVSRQSKTR